MVRRAHHEREGGPPLILSESKEMGGSKAYVVSPLKWFDKHTMSGNKLAFPWDIGTTHPMLLIFGGLPAAGKTSIAVELARRVDAVHLRIDSIEQALRNAGLTILGPEGYLVAYAIAEDNLRLGRTVIADSVNPIEATRAALAGRGPPRGQALHPD